MLPWHGLLMWRAVLTRRLLEIRSDERRALARELHDEFGQNLSAILAFASTIEARLMRMTRLGRRCRRIADSAPSR